MTTAVTKLKEIKRNWHLIDLKDKILGRVATEIALLLQGKHKVNYCANLDCGDFVVVTNAGLIKVTGKKETKKIYSHHSNYPGGFKQISLAQLRQKNPEKIIYFAVRNMLPKNKLRDPRLNRLKIFPGAEHRFQDKFKQLG